MRLCACGCGCSLEWMRSDAKWASEACAKRWLREHPGLPLSAAHSTDVVPTNKPSGLQVSYRKGVRAVARAIRETEERLGSDAWLHRPGGNVRLAEEALLPALPARQRARLQAREEQAA